MIKKGKHLTGVVYTPIDFRKLNQCIQCGHALNIKYGKKCKACKLINLSQCKTCGILLREGLYERYTYDNRKIHRENPNGFKASRELIREFKYIEGPLYKKHDNETCEDCFNLESRIKNVCWFCDVKFKNNKKNYKINGNICPSCIFGLEKNYEQNIKNN